MDEEVRLAGWWKAEKALIEKTYASRITGHADVPPDQLLANPQNYRVHSKKQQTAMQATLRTIGWLDEIIVNSVTGHVINGHMRVTIALREGQPTVPVRYVELTPEEENIALATYDPISALASHDTDTLESLIVNTKTDDQVLEQFLSTLLPGSRNGDYGAADEEEDLGESKFMILVTCQDEEDQARLLELFSGEGLECRALST